jgi:hypothetical protein
MTGQPTIVVMPVFVGDNIDMEKAMTIINGLAGQIGAAMMQLPAAAAGSTRTRAISAQPNTELEWINLKENRPIAREWLLAAGVDDKGKPYVAKSGVISAKALGHFKEFYPEFVGQNLSEVKVEANAEAE